jgi:hypothetical protein
MLQRYPYRPHLDSLLAVRHTARHRVLTIKVQSYENDAMYGGYGRKEQCRSQASGPKPFNVFALHPES